MSKKSNVLKIYLGEVTISDIITLEFHDCGLTKIIVKKKDPEIQYHYFIYDPKESFDVISSIRDDIDVFLFRINEYINQKNKEGKK
jgi:hypothetical protein